MRLAFSRGFYTIKKSTIVEVFFFVNYLGRGYCWRLYTGLYIYIYTVVMKVKIQIRIIR